MNELLIFKRLKAKGHDTQSIKLYLKKLKKEREKEKSMLNKKQYNELDKSGIDSTYQTIVKKRK